MTNCSKGSLLSMSVGMLSSVLQRGDRPSGRSHLVRLGAECMHQVGPTGQANRTAAATEG